MSDAAEDANEESFDKIGFLIASVATILMVAFYFTHMELAFLLTSVVVISIVIWQACDPFAEAAQWVGDMFRIPGSVRGATLDAIASSMPELFSGIFFVLVAISAADATEAARAAAGSEGFGSAIATAAGSAIYNMILIPACCALMISYARPKRPTIDIEDEVVARDGLWFVGCEMVLIVFLYQDQMHWWMGLVFLAMYAIYIYQLYSDARKYRQRLREVKAKLADVPKEMETTTVVEVLENEHGIRVSETTVSKARTELSREARGLNPDPEEDDEPPEAAPVFFGLWDIPLNTFSAVLILLLSTCVAAGACYFLVEVTNETADFLQVPTFFVAVILAAAASSVPDTFLSIGAAKRGDDSGAVSNAFGSNIFDICICLSVPLLVNSYLVNWQPVELTQDGKPIPGLIGLRILLVALTVITLAIIWHNKQLTRNKAIVLCLLYLVFIGYAVMGSLGFLF
ncbi:MAG: hypothetical protein KDA80_21760 [Planctomycetaceae bacterium]|nr:hypothetical protein [Planctomycetaceae bacterium]